jgi:nitrate reductase assembly molybdenum cofactor insertion protein NarJ
LELLVVVVVVVVAGVGVGAVGMGLSLRALHENARELFDFDYLSVTLEQQQAVDDHHAKDAATYAKPTVTELDQRLMWGLEYLHKRAVRVLLKFIKQSSTNASLAKW